MTGLTLALAERASSLTADQIPDDVRIRARHCLLDWFGVTIAGSQEPVACIMHDVARVDASTPGSTVVGTSLRVPLLMAALLNGTASHALDFDDVNPAMLGHPSVAVLGAALALAEAQDRRADDLLTAFVAGYETECRVAMALGAAPYMRGFHATGTVGTMGAAAAAASLLGLDAARTATALGLAATQAAGLKCMIGTMGKPLHAGKAGMNGLLAAQLAAHDFLGSNSAVEDGQGLAAALGGSCDTAAALAGPAEGWHLRNNLFKHHASCFMTHSAIDGISALREAHGLLPDDVASVVVHVSELELRACNIAEPATALEVKFSLTHLAAMALYDADLSVIHDRDASDPALVELRRRVAVVGDGQAGAATHVEIVRTDGTTVDVAHDVLTPEDDLAGERSRLVRKFHALAEPVVGAAAAVRVLAAIEDPDAAVADLMRRSALVSPAGAASPRR